MGEPRPVTTHVSAAWASVSLALSAGVPVLGCLLLASLEDGQHTHVPVHALFEAVGGCIALVLARLLLLQTRYEEGRGHYLWLSTAMVAMGVLDLFHAATQVTPAFFWTRGLATLLGGALAMAVWLPARWAKTRWLYLPASVGVCAVVIGTLLVAFPDRVPLLFVAGGHYTLPAKVINVAGGVGFLAAAAWFVRRWAKTRSVDDIVFANHCVLFAAAALLFAFSYMWGPVWWFFHGLRLAAYLIVLRYVFTMFHGVRQALAAANKGLEIRVRQRTEQLEREKEARELFVAALSHDLRSPLSAALLSGNLLLRSDGTPERNRRTATRIVRSMERASNMIDDLLDVNRITAGRPLPLDIEACDLRTLADAVVDDLAAVHGDRFHVEGPAELQGSWSCRSLRRVLENLMTNAVKYGTPDSPITLTLASAGDTVTVAVHNDGDPIPPGDQEQIFSAYARTRSAEASGERGWGIGLTLVRGYVEAHGGTVSVRSTPDDGTTFVITLPRDARLSRVEPSAMTLP